MRRDQVPHRPADACLAACLYGVDVKKRRHVLFITVKTACNREGFPVPRRRVDAPRPLHDYHDLPPR